jgi:hypothetical protein
MDRGAGAHIGADFRPAGRRRQPGDRRAERRHAADRRRVARSHSLHFRRQRGGFHSLPASRRGRNAAVLARRAEPGVGPACRRNNAVNPKTGTIRGRAIFDNKDGLLTPGFFGRLRLFGGEHDALLIPDTAIASDQSRKIVFTVADDGTVGTKLVELGPIVDGLRVIRSGLAPTDRIVIDGLQRARPGQKVKPEDGTIAPPARAASTTTP